MPSTAASKKTGAKSKTTSTKAAASKSADKPAKKRAAPKKTTKATTTKTAEKPETPAVVSPAEVKAPAPRKAEPATTPKTAKVVEPETKADEPAKPAPTPEQPAPSPATSATEPGNLIHMKLPIVVKDLASALNLKPFQVISDLMQQNILASINQTIEEETARVICEKHSFVLEVEKRERQHTHGTAVEEAPKVEKPVEKKIERKNLQPRAPVVTIMGHVDHGKTSLLDAIRETNVVRGEAGGITQHIGAYTIEVDSGGKKHPITFLDTPGHEAFSAMRARGANITDIVVLVVAADDGLMPQTLEAISHARAAKVPILVAINKIDLPSADQMKTRVKKQLQEKSLASEDWGGDTICCEVSAIKKTGIEHLLEMILLQAELLELKADPTVPMRGHVVEAQMEQGRGVTATILVKEGTLERGMPFVVGPYWGKVKALLDDKGKALNTAKPSQAVKVVGLTGLPSAGAEYRVMPTETDAREHSEAELAKRRTGKLEAPGKVSLENLFDTIAEGQKKNLRVVLKADVHGSAEAVSDTLVKIPSDKVRLELIHSAVGPISESDILLASASNAIVIGFNVKIDASAAEMAKREGVQVKLYRIIYELVDEVKAAMAGLLDPEIKIKVSGQVEIKQVFNVAKGRVAGCVVNTGRVARNGRARLVRDGNILWEGQVTTLKRFQDDVNEVRTGLECGIRLGNYQDFEVGDVIEVIEIEKIVQKL